MASKTVCLWYSDSRADCVMERQMIKSLPLHCARIPKGFSFDISFLVHTLRMNRDQRCFSWLHLLRRSAPYFSCPKSTLQGLNSHNYGNQPIRHIRPYPPGWRKGEILILSLLPRSRGYNVAEVETVRLAVSCNLLCNLDHSIFTDTLYNE